MSDLKVSQLQNISQNEISDDDLIPIVDVSETYPNRSKSISIPQIISSKITGSNNFIPMFSGSNKLINSKISYDRFGDNTTIDSYLTVNKEAVFKTGISLNSPSNLYDCYLILGNDKVLFPSDSGEGLVLTSTHNDDKILTLKGFNNSTILTLDEEEIRTNKKLNVYGDSTVNGSLTVTGMLTAETYHTEYVTSSIIYSSGSTKFGDSSDDKHEFTGSLYTQGGATFTDNVNLYSSLRVDDELNAFGQFTAYSYSIFDNQVQCNSDVTITGISTLNGNTSFNGESTFNNNVYINDDVSIGGSLNCDSYSFFDNDATFNSNIICGGDLQTSTLLVNGIISGSAFNKFVTTGSFNVLTGSVNTLSSSFDSRINNHTHTNFNNDLRISGSVAITGSLDVVGGTNKIQFNISQGAAGDIPAGASFWNYGGNFTLMGNPQGTSGHKLVVASFNGSTWRSMLETANTGSGNEPNLLLAKTAGRVGIRTLSPSASLDVSGSFRVAPTTISSSNQSGTAGQIYWDANYIYVCTATNTWKSASLS